METGVFKPVSKKDIIDAIKKLPSNKASISNDIPVSVMKQFANCYCEKLTNILNDCLKENRFPNLMKVAEISPVFKKLDNTSKDNSQQTFVLMKTSSRRLDQDEYVRLSFTSSEDVFKTSWSRPIYSSWQYVFKASSRRFQDIFKTSSRCFQDLFKTSSKRLHSPLSQLEYMSYIKLRLP